ncbi:MAG: internal scaffolding protein [Microviridae sp.]|nr:MAG: internal scaffolding protein [Microviridae sp.]
MEVKIFVRSPYNYDVDAASDASGLRCEDPSLAHQSFKEECDINTIVERFGLGYSMPEGLAAPSYGDFTEVRDFQGALNAIATARESFDALPANVRARFQNDPGAFVDFCDDARNRPEAEALGLVFKRPAAVPATSGDIPGMPAGGTPPKTPNMNPSAP